eukprot:TRINITY_DN11386_c0_g1_i2.p1 TRINITY_DN11386_c0_g1~~TRINITY_DN11386_c0_g1_i2.p1  ORF type:complete len:168 (-),score=64.87 TRINITY_DN11386_c0_g1_i2:34-480(-)
MCIRDRSTQSTWGKLKFPTKVAPSEIQTGIAQYNAAVDTFLKLGKACESVINFFDKIKDDLVKHDLALGFQRVKNLPSYKKQFEGMLAGDSNPEKKASTVAWGLGNLNELAQTVANSFAGCNFYAFWEITTSQPVSYTHLTLPTIYSV